MEAAKGGRRGSAGAEASRDVREAAAAGGGADHGIWSVWNNILSRMISRTLYTSNHQEGMKRTLWLGFQRRTGCSQLKVHIGLRFTEV
jgi:hypothetical protein